MVGHKYAFKGYNAELMARAIALDMPVSTKQVIELCNFLRNKNLQKAKQTLARILEKKEAVPVKRFTNGVGHKPGDIAAGRYPIKAAEKFLRLFSSVEINAQNKGINTGELQIIHLCAHKAHTPMKHGRQSRRQAKRTHVEVVVQEVVKEKKDKKTKKVESTKETKKEVGKKESIPKKVEEVKSLPKEATKSKENKKDDTTNSKDQKDIVVNEKESTK